MPVDSVVMARFIVGDTRDVTASLPDGSVDLVLTSPPFLALRSYLPADHPDKGREIGSEATPAEFLQVLLSLAAEWRRVLAPHGSIAVELGDTYSGSGGAGGDYAEGGMREGQPTFRQTSGWHRGEREGRSEGAAYRKAGTEAASPNGGAGWPLAKSLCGIPHLFHLSLAYGRNLLTGEPSPAGQWRVRNVVAWCRPNPPVGALGDKFRPATSYMTIATPSRTRYFDLDAVRVQTGNDRDDRGSDSQRVKDKRDGGGSHHGVMRQVVGQNPAGAPPLDWWEIPTQPYKGSHYATWPEALCDRPILAMVPPKVCTTCGEPSRRITDVTDEYRQALIDSNGGRGRGDLGDDPNVRPTGGTWIKPARESVTTGWSDCGHGSHRCRRCHVLVPSDYAVRRPGEAQGSSEEVGAQAVLGEPVEVTGEPEEHTGDLRDVRGRVHGPAELEVLHPELFGTTGACGGQGQHLRREDGTAELAMAGRAEGDGPGLRHGLGSGGDTGPAEDRLHDGTPAGDTDRTGAPAGEVGDRPSPQRCEGRQPAGEPGSRDESTARRDGAVPALPGDVPGQLTDGYVCPCGSRDIEYVADHWRRGIVLDPFAGSGTTLKVAVHHGRDAIGIDIDERNAELARDRVGMFLTVEHHRTEVAS